MKRDLFEFKPGVQIQPEDKLVKLVLVTQDCTDTQIPTNQGGTFDFEAVKSKWE